MDIYVSFECIVFEILFDLSHPQTIPIYPSACLSTKKALQEMQSFFYPPLKVADGQSLICIYKQNRERRSKLGKSFLYNLGH